jgi:DNA-binding transcriptional MerR regulator
VKSDANGMTIDELARRTRTTTRTLRLYQTKALLPPPRIIGRVGYYTDLHVNRLVIIERLQARGFSLAGIAELLKMWEEGKRLDELFGVEAKLTQPWNQEQPEDFTVEEFRQRWPQLGGHTEHLDQSVKLGLIEMLEDGRLRVMSPKNMSFGHELILRGVPIDVVMQQSASLREETQRMAQRFFDIFGTYILPKLVHGEPQEWLPRLADYSAELRPAVQEAILNMFARAMDERIDKMRAPRTGDVEEEVIADSEPHDPDPGAPPLKSAAGAER